MDHAFDLRVVGKANEDAEVGGAGYHHINNLADRVCVEQFFDVCGKHFALRDDHFISARVDVDDLDVQFLSDELLQLFRDLDAVAVRNFRIVFEGEL